MKRLKAILQKWIARLQKQTHTWWYPPLIGLLAALDFFVFVIPTDGMLVGGVLLNPRRWFAMAFTVAIGSSLGALVLAALVKMYGMSIVMSTSPNIVNSAIWQSTEKYMASYGSLTLFAIGASPIMQHPAVILSALTSASLPKIFFVFLAGRLTKFILIGWIASHAPHLLRKIWGVQPS